MIRIVDSFAPLKLSPSFLLTPSILDSVYFPNTSNFTFIFMNTRLIQTFQCLFSLISIPIKIIICIFLFSNICGFFFAIFWKIVQTKICLNVQNCYRSPLITKQNGRFYYWFAQYIFCIFFYETKLRVGISPLQYLSLLISNILNLYHSTICWIGHTE